MLLDKNPEQDFKLRIIPILKQNRLNSILCSEPFLKAEFIEKFIQNSQVPILYLDFDLLYSGFVSGGFVSRRDNLELYRPSGDKLENMLKNCLEKISKQKSILIIDSLNGFYNIFDEKDAGRLINSFIMLLSFVAKTTDTQVFLVSMARINEKDSWVLTPSGRQIITSDHITKILLKQNDSGMTVNFLDEKNKAKESIKILN